MESSEQVKLEKIVFEAVSVRLQQFKGNKSKAAKSLGISRTTLMRKLQYTEVKR